MLVDVSNAYCKLKNFIDHEDGFKNCDISEDDLTKALSEAMLG